MNGSPAKPAIFAVDNSVAERLTRALLDVLYAFPVETKAGYVAREIACYAIDWMRHEIDPATRSTQAHVAENLATLAGMMKE